MTTVFVHLQYHQTNQLINYLKPPQSLLGYKILGIQHRHLQLGQYRFQLSMHHYHSLLILISSFLLRLLLIFSFLPYPSLVSFCAPIIVISGQLHVSQVKQDPLFHERIHLNGFDQDICPIVHLIILNEIKH